MKKDFDTALQNITAGDNKKALVSKRLIEIINKGPLVLSAQQKNMLSGQIKMLLKTLQKDIDSIDTSKKPNNKVWSVQGPVAMADKLSAVKKAFKSVSEWVEKHGLNSDTYRTALEKIESLERDVKSLKTAQNQSGIMNWFQSRFPVIVR